MVLQLGAIDCGAIWMMAMEGCEGCWMGLLRLLRHGIRMFLLLVLLLVLMLVLVLMLLPDGELMSARCTAQAGN